MQTQGPGPPGIPWPSLSPPPPFLWWNRGSSPGLWELGLPAGACPGLDVRSSRTGNSPVLIPACLEAHLWELTVRLPGAPELECFMGRRP